MSRSFVVFILPNDGSASRFGLTTSRKVGRAHERNRIRRRVREILRTARQSLPTGMDVVVNPRRSVNERAFEELRSELVSLLAGGAS
jgi:ribonuclease P protein component